MNRISKGPALVGVGILLLGAADLALTNAIPVFGASQIQPARIHASCDSTNPCQKFTNGGDGAGLEGISKGTGGSSLQAAVEGSGNSIGGVGGYSANADGGLLENDNNVYFSAVLFSDASGGDPLNVDNIPDGGDFYVDNLGDGYFTGTVTATGYMTDLRTRGGQVGAFNAQSTRATIEDTGTARLNDGEGAVRFDSALARVIDLHQGYQVFLTPDGETRGLYVASKYEGGFIVREIEHGRSHITFDYRVVAHEVGASDARLPALTIKWPSRTDPARIPK